MAKYSDKVLDIFYNPTYAGTIKGYYGMGKFKDLDQEEDLKIFVVIDNDVIKDIRFQTSGSIISHASLSILSELAINKSVVDAKKISVFDIISRLQQVPKAKFSCVPSSIECLKNALKSAEKRKGTMISFSATIAKNFYIAKNISNIIEENNKIQEAILDSSEQKIQEQKKQVVIQETQNTSKEIFSIKKTEKINNTTKVDKKTKSSLVTANTELKNDKKLEKSKKEQKFVKNENLIESLKKDEFIDNIVVDKKPNTKEISNKVKTVSKKAVEKQEKSKSTQLAKVDESVVAIKNIKEQQANIGRIESAPTKIEIRVVDEKTPEEEFAENKKRQKGTTKKEKPIKATQQKEKSVVAIIEPKEEVLPLEEESQPEQAVAKVVKTTTTTKTNTYQSVFKMDENKENQNDELNDEIDTITAKLTDAISKLNFKFDDDDTNN